MRRIVGSVDFLVNNSGIFPSKPMLEMGRWLWQRVLGINLTGWAFTTQLVGLRMVEGGSGGKIVNNASVDALHSSMAGLSALYDRAVAPQSNTRFVDTP